MLHPAVLIIVQYLKVDKTSQFIQEVKLQIRKNMIILRILMLWQEYV